MSTVICPKCSQPSRVVYARGLASDPKVLERRRICTGCGHSFTTHETTAAIVTRRTRKAARGGARAVSDPDAAEGLRLRKYAQAEARKSGRPVAEVMRDWGLDSAASGASAHG